MMIGLAASQEMRDGPRQPSKFKRICVFCGSRHGNKTAYRAAAIDLAEQLVSREIDLVYGGGSIGLMGLVSEAVFRSGRHAIGETLGEVRLVADMHQRKAEMARQSDAFIALPGGYGTLEELFEIITWSQLGIHRKPIGLLNVDGYYDSLLTFIDQAVVEGFVSFSARRIIISAPTAHELLDNLEEYVPYYDRVASRLKWETRVTQDESDDPRSFAIHDTPSQVVGQPEEDPGERRVKRVKNLTVNGP
ncbi:hypothetical protein EJB05_28520, partial [Eragrostis curvula]